MRRSKMPFYSTHAEVYTPPDRVYVYSDGRAQQSYDGMCIAYITCACKLR